MRLILYEFSIYLVVFLEVLKSLTSACQTSFAVIHPYHHTICFYLAIRCMDCDGVGLSLFFFFFAAHRIISIIEKMLPLAAFYNKCYKLIITNQSGIHGF